MQTLGHFFEPLYYKLRHICLFQQDICKYTFPCHLQRIVTFLLQQNKCQDECLTLNLIKICQGFTKLHSGSGLNRLRPQELKEYSDSYPVLDYLGPVLGSKCLVMQTTGNYLGLSWTRTFRGDLGEDVSGCHLDF
jgi:hypothetical protein